MDLMKKLTTAACWCLSLALPVKKNRVVFCSYYGRGYSDNPKAIAQAMLDMGTHAELVWLLKNEEDAKSLPRGIRPCPYDSPKRIWTLATARVWVDNCRKYDRFKKKNQYYLQTWHGFPLKRIEKDALDSLAPDFEKGAVKDSRHTDLLLSNSAHSTTVLRRAYWYDGAIGQYGSPRNDVFFTAQPQVREKVLHHFGLDADRKLLLYAPTFRADHSTDAYRIQMEQALKACEKRFGGLWTGLVRLHPNVAGQSAGLFLYDRDRILDATSYPDMQELLICADLLITDYSSSMFDYALSRRPCIQFALDLDCYRKDRNFYFPLDQLPFPLATTNGELEEKILHFDEETYLTQWDHFRSTQSFYEDGNASKRCARWIEDRINGKD